MATILYLDGKEVKVKADKVQFCLANGYSVTPEPVKEVVEEVVEAPKKKRGRPAKED